MYKIIWLVRFRRDRELADVLRWWRGPHAELARATPGMVRYVQSYWRSGLDPVTQLPGAPAHFDGHAEHWFADADAYRAAIASPEWQATLADGPSHFDSSTLVGGELEELVITWADGPDGRAGSQA